MDNIAHVIATFWQNLQQGQLPQLGAWNYALLAVLVAVEGPIATLLGAAAAAAGLMRPDLVFLSAAAGNLLADLGWYTLGYLGRVEWLLRYGRWLGVRRRHLDRLQRAMHHHARKILLVAKLTAGLVIPSLVAAGLARVPLRRWFPVVAAAEMLWTGTLVLVGFYAAAAIAQVERGLHILAILGALLLFLGLLEGIRRWFRSQEALLAEEEEDPVASPEDVSLPAPGSAGMALSRNGVNRVPGPGFGLPQAPPPGINGHAPAPKTPASQTEHPRL